MSYVLEIHMETFTDAMRWCLWFVSSTNNLEVREKLDGGIDEQRLLWVKTGGWVYGCLLFLYFNFSIKSLKDIFWGKSLLINRCLNCTNYMGIYLTYINNQWL